MMRGVPLQVDVALRCAVGCPSVRAAANGGRMVLCRPASTCVSPLRRAAVLSTTLYEHKVGWLFVSTRSNAFRCALMHLARCGPAMCSFGTLCMCGCQCARAIPILKASADILTPWRFTHPLTAAFRRHDLTDPPWAGTPKGPYSTEYRLVV